MRQYEPIWNRLKLDHTASIQAPVHLHLRIIKAVKKEKTKDQGWKLLVSEKNLAFKLHREIEGETITFSFIEIATKIELKDL
ncbi:MAG: hypothetical protein COB66_01400 [Coxiella sp. (in: Bacteria)]|nr:MAG: hypothetical protein COB66_01400 [Coxiella sp. (in: g-proteobacteria)]